MKIIFVALLFIVILISASSTFDYIEYKNLPWKATIGQVFCDRQDINYEEYFAYLDNSNCSVVACNFKRWNFIVCFLFEENEMIGCVPTYYFFRLKEQYFKDNNGVICC